MRTRTLLIVAAFILAACSNRTITMTLNDETRKVYRDKNAARLATQLENINYPSTVTHKGEIVNIRVGQAPIRDVRRAVCHRIGWPSSEGKMVQLDDTLRFLR